MTVSRPRASARRSARALRSCASNSRNSSLTRSAATPASRRAALERRRAKISDVDAPGAQDDARRAPLVVERHEPATSPLGDATGERQRAAWHREIEIDTVAADAAQDSIAYGTAHEHGVL